MAARPLISSLEEMIPVDASNNPFLNRPEDLIEHTWYLVLSDQIRGSDVGSWRQVGEPRRMLLPDSLTVCWKTVRAFHDGDVVETEWMMLQYEITTPNGTVSICRIGKGPMNHDAQVGGGGGGGPYPFLAAAAAAASSGNLPESVTFLVGDYLELLDLDAPLLPYNN
ncbi:hypothetical protein MLD38_034932 [Melastoma candidum]|uniref:Uncharacterized protein n=1 Tax=Melastoma candidum TaxID=119954 RepID=A0ACB9MBH6_9MYRT|nr:hypothetical protein MLD38_034932 [Melastoma candidum]